MTSSTTGRTTLFLTAFVTAAALATLVYQLTNTTSVLFGLCIIVLLTVTGALFLSTRNVLSRATSASVLFILAVISLRIGHSIVPDAYLFVIAFVFSLIGSLPRLHRKQSSFKKAAFYSCLIAMGALLITAVFIYSITILQRLS